MYPLPVMKRMISSHYSTKQVTKKVPKPKRLRNFLPCVDRKDAFKALKVKNLLFFKLSIGTHILSHTSIKLFA